MQGFYHEFLLKLHNGRISLARLNKLVDKLWGSVKIMTIEIWQSRNNHKYDKKLLPQQTIISNINAQPKTIILAHFQKHKRNDATCKKIFTWWRSPVNEEIKEPKYDINPNKLYHNISEKDGHKYYKPEREEQYRAPLLKPSERRMRAILQKQAAQIQLSLNLNRDSIT